MQILRFLSSIFCISILTLGVAAMVSSQTEGSSASIECINVKNYGAIGDGVNDDTGAIQAAIDAASVNGGMVFMPAGKYLVTKSISVKPGVSLQGAANAPQYNELKGTVILATWGRDQENADALFEMGSSTCVRGLTIYYPEQKAKDIHPYAWTFRLFDSDNTLENINLINSYNAILVGGKQWDVRHRIRSVYGCALRRGIFVDGCSDVGRIDNVHFHGHWWWSEELGGAPDNPDGTFGLVNQYMLDNLEAFIFGRTDWEYVTNTFVFIAKTGYRFIDNEKGAGSYQMSGIGADAVRTGALIEASVAWWTILINNGQFASDPRVPGCVGIVIKDNKNPAFNGSVRLVNSSILAPRAVISHGSNVVSLTGCFVNAWSGSTGEPLIEADNGKLQVIGCTFDARSGQQHGHATAIALRKGLKSAIIADNMAPWGVEIINEIGSNAILRDNEPYKVISDSAKPAKKK